MRRILLIIDDFNELVGLETLFRRLGFDVLTLGRDATVGEAILGFPPDLVIATARGRHVDGLKLSPKIRQGTSRPKLMLLMPQGAALTSREIADGQIDATIETPFEPRVALKAVCRLLNLAVEPLLEKYAKIVSARLLEPEEMKIIKHQPQVKEEVVVSSLEPVKQNPAIPPPTSGPSREDRYKKFLDDADDELPPIADISKMKDAQKRLANDSKADDERLRELDREKREFVRVMMTEGQSGNQNGKKS